MAAGYSVIDRDGHKNEVMQMVLEGVPYSKIAAKYGYSKDTVAKYVKERLFREVAMGNAHNRKKLTADFMNTMSILQKKMELFIEACEDWLKIPGSKRTKYTLEPRADELNVIYTEKTYDDNGKVQYKRQEATLQELLDKALTVGSITIGEDSEEEIKLQTKEVQSVKYMRLDPRSMILSALAEARKQTELIAKVTGDLKDITDSTDIYGTVVPLIVKAIIDETRGNSELRQRLISAIEGNLAAAEKENSL